MTRYAVDYSGWLYVEADTELEAHQKAVDILADSLPNSDWELVNIEKGT